MDAATITCSSCGASVPLGKRFCGHCGAALGTRCSSCGAESRPGMRFCEECGASLSSDEAAGGAVEGMTPVAPQPSPSAISAPLPPAPSAPPHEERRLVTAVFCDLVEFTPLSEQLDPEDIRDVQAEYFGAMSQQIERYGGIVEKYAGDAVLALFGAPAAHEDDAERAVLCALGMQAAIEPVAEQARRRWRVTPAIRVGVNTGEVVSGTWNASGRQDVAVTGDAVNTAARIQATAEAGEVLVGSETMRLTRRRIRYGDGREVALKGKVGTIPVYPAIGLRERFGERWETSDQASPLVGRDREMVQLLDAWVRAQAGEGQLVTVIGDVGVGKSRLLSELVDRVAGPSARVIRARCLSYGQQVSLWLIADFLRGLFGITEQDGLDEVRAKLAAALPALLGRPDEATQAEALDVVGEVLGLPPGDSLLATAGAQIRRQSLIRGLRLVLGTLSERAPTVLVFEDVHWIDEASQDVLKILSDVPGLRMLVLAAQRPGWNAPWSEWGWTERVTLRPLSNPEAIALARAVLGGVPLSAELEAYVSDRAGGNPFFVEEMLRALQESGGLVEHDEAMHLVPGAAARLPSTLTEVLLARLDRLEGEVKNVAQVGSVIGRSFAVSLLGRVLDQDATDLEAPLSALQQAEIAFPTRGSDLEYVFKHVSMREVAYNTLVQKRKQDLHLRTARAIAATYPSEEYVEVIAYHYAQTPEDTEAAEWLERAGDRAAGVYANESAIAAYEEALQRLGRTGAEDIVLARIYEKVGAVLHTVAHFDAALEILEKSVDIYQVARDLEAVGRVTASIGRVHRVQGRVDEGVARLQPLLEALDESGPSPGLASLYVALAHLYFAGGRYEEVVGAAARGAQIAEIIHDDLLLATAKMRQGAALHLLGNIRTGADLMEQSVRLAEAEGDLTTLSISVSNLGELYVETGDLHRGREYVERSLQMAERVGEIASMGYSMATIGWILYFLGEWDEAEGSIAHGAEVIRSVGSSWYSAYPPLHLGRLKLAQGVWDEAEQSLAETLRIAEPIGDIQALEGAHRLLAELEILQARPEAALDRLAPMAGSAPLPDQIGLLAMLAWAQLEIGLLTEADESAARALEMAAMRQHKPLLPEALRVQAMIRSKQERWSEAQQIFSESASLAQALPYPYGEAQVRLEWGVALLERGEAKGARDQLTEALQIFDKLRAMKGIERSRQALRTLEPLADPA